ncbi:Uncharacterized protein APZ42_034568 [Daphnia magna]|uniref:Uncharacterized protein n=1 Tax=Daphnia magna TaxID=35525 RepID=A0A164K141_9CRUS|nr:Uncharacterized protein APZ42_034568 [Daphnia magna]
MMSASKGNCMYSRALSSDQLSILSFKIFLKFCPTLQSKIMLCIEV